MTDPIRWLPALLLAACASPLVPEGTAGRFVLQEIDGDPVPAVMAANAYVTTEIVADTLWLETDGTGLRRTTYRSTEPGGSPRTYRSEDAFSHSLQNGRLEIAIECNDVVIRSMASCVAPPHLFGSADGAALELEDFHGNRLRYQAR